MIFLKIPLIAVSFVAITFNHHCFAPSMVDECNQVLKEHYNSGDNQGLDNAEKAFYEKTPKTINESFPFNHSASEAAEAKRQQRIGFVLGYFNALLESLYNVLDLSTLMLEGDFCKNAAENVYAENTNSSLNIANLKIICEKHTEILLKNRSQYPVKKFNDKGLNLRWSTLRVLYTEWTGKDIVLKNIIVDYDQWAQYNIGYETKMWNVIIFGASFFGHYRLLLSYLRPTNNKIPDVATHCNTYADKGEA